MTNRIAVRAGRWSAAMIGVCLAGLSIAFANDPISPAPRVIQAGGPSRNPCGAADWTGHAPTSKVPVRVGQQIIVKVQNLEQAGDPALLILYLNGHPLPDMKALVDQAAKGCIAFDFVRTPASKDTWRALLASPCTPSCVQRTFRLTVGPPAKAPYDSDTTLDVRLFRRTLTIAFGIVGAVCLLIVLGTRHIRETLLALLRDHIDPGKAGPYSLARVQMALWFVTVLGAFVVIYIVTGYYDDLNASCLALIGISGGTTALAAIVDGNAKREAERVHRATAHAAPTSRSILANKVLHPASNHGFVRDLTTWAESDPSLHRIQMMAWTGVLWLIFVTEVWTTMTMPAFSQGLLGLMGISSGVYVGLKGATEQV